MKKMFIDTETTGLNAWSNSVVEISGIVEVDEEKVEEFTVYLQPKPEDRLDQKALNVIGKTPSELMYRGVSQAEGKEKFEEILKRYVDPFDKTDKLAFYAYNSPFDNKFLRQLWKDQNDKFFGSFFWSPDICIMRLAMEHMLSRRVGMQNFKQSTVASVLGVEIEEEKLHTAMYDTILSRKIYHAIKEEGEL